MLKRREVFSLSLLAISGAMTPLCAAETPDLDTLFAKLRDPATGAKVLSIEPQIWDQWMHGGTNTQNEALAKASAAMSFGDFKVAEAMLDALLSETKTYPEVWNKRATLYFIKGRFEESLADIVKTLDLEPRHFGALSGRGMIYQRLGRNAEALIAFKQALEIHPTMAGARLSVKQLEQLLPEL
jgi:tetratricopeptide (TPR) repeat protein